MKYGAYTSDDGAVACALWVDDDTFVVMGFSAAPVSSYKRPHGLLTRKQVFQNTAGHELRLPMPTTSPPYTFPGPVTIRGDSTYVPTAVLGEINRGEAT